MGKRGKKKGQRPALVPALAAPSISTAKEGEGEGEGEDNCYGKKLVFTSLISIDNQDRPTLSWAMLDPHYSGPPTKDDEQNQDCIGFKQMNIPADLDLHRLIFYDCAVCESKVYFIGGMYYDTRVCSDKVFIYDLTSKKWEEEGMNVARAFPKVAAVGNVIYVFGSVSGDHVLNIPYKEQWAECYNVNSKTWEFLPSPPQAVFDSFMKLVAVYEHGNQILLWMDLAGLYSYNYVTKTWKSFHPAINKFDPLIYDHVAVVEDVLFWHYFGAIFAFDLSNNQFLLAHPLDKNKKATFEPLNPGGSPSRTFLVRVGKETLFLISMGPDYSSNKIHCYRFRIEKSSGKGGGGAGECGFHLVSDGRAVFNTQGYTLGTHVW